MTTDLIKVLFSAVVSFMIGIAITPYLSGFMYKHKMWRKKSRSQENVDAMSDTFKKIHNEKGETGTPRVGGVIIWISVLAVIVILYIISFFVLGDVSAKLNFLSRNQTLLPLGMFLFASIFGLADDLLQIYGKGLNLSEGISRKVRVLTVLMIGAVGAAWFYFKLQNLSVHIPFYGDMWIGLLFIPFFIAVVFVIFSGSVIDGIDGLAGGVLSAAFGAYTIIAIAQHQVDIAAFCAAIIGGLLAFLWFNIPPARFYLGETGIMGLTITLAVVAFLTNQVVVLPIIALPLIVTSLSSSLQMFSKKYFGKKLFKIAPLHHHFEALGWPPYKVTMRYWIISIICAIIGTVIALIG
ncbi:MAG: hypothetical protein WCQ00_02225 [bacterium]